jgi:Ring finger domain
MTHAPQVQQRAHQCSVCNQTLALPGLQEQLDSFGVAHSHFTEKEQLVSAILHEGGSSAATCSICFDDYVRHASLRVLPCKHRFHAACVDKWLLGSAKSPAAKHLVCPLCSAAIRPRR